MMFVLDTSAFTDPRLREALGAETLEEVVDKLMEQMSWMRMCLGFDFFMPRDTFRELERFLLRNGVRAVTVQGLQEVLVVRAPNRRAICIPGDVFHRYMSMLTQRLFKALRLAEFHVREVATRVKVSLIGDPVPSTVNVLRSKFRQQVRHGIIDTPEDLDAVLLAAEIKAPVVTNDEGIAEFASDMGLQVIDPVVFARMLARYGTQAEKVLEKCRIGGKV